MSTIARISQAAAMASREAAWEYMVLSTPMTAKTIATAPKVTI